MPAVEGLSPDWISVYYFIVQQTIKRTEIESSARSSTPRWTGYWFRHSSLPSVPNSTLLRTKTSVILSLICERYHTFSEVIDAHSFFVVPFHSDSESRRLFLEMCLIWQENRTLSCLADLNLAWTCYYQIFIGGQLRQELRECLVWGYHCLSFCRQNHSGAIILFNNTVIRFATAGTTSRLLTMTFTER